MKNVYISLAFISIGLLLGGVVCYFAPNPFEGSYSSVLLRQYDYYRNIKEPGKILVIGGSSIPYGIDLDVMEATTERRCAELGLFWGTGSSYLMEASKCNMHSGDVVVLEFDNGMNLDTFAPLYMLSSVARRPNMYRYFAPRYWLSIAGYYPSYIFRCYYYHFSTYLDGDSVNGSSFDERGCMTYFREGDNPGLDLNESKLSVKNSLSPDSFSQEYIDYLNEYVDYCKTQNVKVLFTYVPYWDESVDLSEEECERFDETLSSKLKAPLATSLKDSLFPKKYVWDLPRHLNTEGAKIRSKRLAEALKPYLESE